MSVIRLPSWTELLRADAPWAYHLRAGGAGLWLMRGEAEEVDGLDCRFVAGVAARTWDALTEELGLALEAEPTQPSNNLLLALGAVGPLALLVTDADKLLADEPARLPQLLESLRAAADATTLRVIFQARDLPAATLALFTEYEVATIA